MPSSMHPCAAIGPPENVWLIRFYLLNGYTPDRRQPILLSSNVDQKSLETEFSIAICRPTGDKWQSKTLFLVIFDSRSSIVKSVFDSVCPVWGRFMYLQRVVKRIIIFCAVSGSRPYHYISSLVIGQNLQVLE